MICHCIKYYISDQLWSTVIQINLSDVVFQANMWCLLIFEMNNDAIFCLPATVACAFTSAVVFHHIGHRPPCFQVNPGVIYQSVPELENSLWFLWGFIFTPNSLHWNWCQVFGRFTTWKIKSQNTKMFFWPRDMCQGPGRCMCGCVHTSQFLFSRNSLILHLRLSVTSMMGMSVFCKQRFISFLCQHLKCFSLCWVTHGCRLFKKPSAWIYISALWSPVISARLASQWRTMSSQALWENPKRITLYTHITFTPGANLSAIFAGDQLKK